MYARLNTCLIVLLISFYAGETWAKKFTRCQLTGELLKNNFPKTYLSHWVCLIDQESGRETTKVLQKRNGSKNYGIFQINSKKWCKEGKKGGFCNVACESLTDDDIRDDARCAAYIQEKEGFKEWPGWLNRCKESKQLPDINKCPQYTEAPRQIRGIHLRSVRHIFNIASDLSYEPMEPDT